MSHVPGVPATRFEPAGDPIGTALLVPGRGYPAVAPLLWFAQQTLLEHGWSVRQLWWDPPPYENDEQTGSWVRAQVEAALPASGRVLLVSKSLGTWAAPLAAERGYEAIWFTPLLQVPRLVDVLGTAPSPRLLVGGTADDLAWRPDVARTLVERGCDVCELPDADHALQVPGDVARSAEVLVDVVRAVDAFLARLPA
jgi:predicted alpha/beta-hydrolase family hydrolase